MATDFEKVFGTQTEIGREAIDGAQNPGKYMGNINNPLAKSLIALSRGYEAGAAMPALAGGLGMIGAGIRGAAEGFQMGQEEAPLSAVSPNLATAFPELADTPAPLAYNIMTKMQSYFAMKAKPQAIIDAGDLDAITSVLDKKGYKGEEATQMAQSLLGQDWGLLKTIPIKKMASPYAEARLEMQRKAGKVGEGNFTYGLVPKAMNYQPFGQAPKGDKLEGNDKLDDDIAKLTVIQERLNALYDGVIRLAETKGIAPQVALDSYLKSDPEASALMATAGTMLPMIAKGYAQEVGNLSQFEQENARGLLPKLTPSWFSGMPDTIEALRAKQATFNQMAGIGQKIMYSRAFRNAISTVKSGIYGSRDSYISDLRTQYSNNPELLSLIDSQLAPAKTSPGKGKTSKPSGDALDNLFDEAGL